MSEELRLAEQAFLKTGLSLSLFRKIVDSDRVEDVVTRLAEGDATAAEEVVEEYYEHYKATADDE